MRIHRCRGRSRVQKPRPHRREDSCTQPFFASGGFADKSGKEAEKLNPEETFRFWNEAKPLFEKLADEPDPHTAYELVQTLCHLLPCDPEAAFLLRAQSIQSSSAAGFQNESLAIGAVVRMRHNSQKSAQIFSEGSLDSASRKCLKIK
jgi:hypothetical protein